MVHACTPATLMIRERESANFIVTTASGHDWHTIWRAWALGWSWWPWWPRGGVALTLTKVDGQYGTDIQSSSDRTQNMRRSDASRGPLERRRDFYFAVLLFFPRLAIMTIVEGIAFIACLVAGTGAGPPTAPLAPWRRALVAAVVPPCARVVLWTCGFWALRVRGEPWRARRQGALVVSGHASIVDGFVLSVLLGAPAFVAKVEGLRGLPLYGTIFRAMQLLYVDRASPASRKGAVGLIRDRCRDGSGFPPLVIFPEGTTNGGAATDLLPFKAGAFIPGVPVHPVVLRYPGVDLTQATGGGGGGGSSSSSDDPPPSIKEMKSALAAAKIDVPAGFEKQELVALYDKHRRDAARARGGGEGGLWADLKLIGRLMLRVENKCHVSFLPARAPSEAERKDAALFAANVRRAMVAYRRETAAEHRRAAAAGASGWALAGATGVIAAIYWLGSTLVLRALGGVPVSRAS